MNVPVAVVVERADDWLVAVGGQSETLAAGVAAEEIAICLRLMSKLAGVRHPLCVLAPGSQSCYFASIVPGEGIDVRDRAALTYELESHLPIDAESMVADFSLATIPGVPPKVSAIAIETRRWQAIAEAIEAEGSSVRSIVPRAVLATRAIGSQIENQTTELFLVDAPRCDGLLLDGGRVQGWKHFYVDDASIRRHQVMQTGEPTVVLVGETSDSRLALQRAYPAARTIDQPIDQLVLQAAAQLHARRGRSAVAFDLRRGGLAPADPLAAIRTPLRIVAAAAIACLLAVAAGGWWRTQRIDQEIGQLREQQQTLFREAFPGARVPGALLRRVRSEHTKALGSSGETTPIEVPVSAAGVLRELMAALPNDTRFRLTRIQIRDGDVDLEVQVRSPVDAGTLANALSGAGFEVKPPGTTRIDAGTFRSSLEARWNGNAVGSPAGDEVSVRIVLGWETAS